MGYVPDIPRLQREFAEEIDRLVTEHMLWSPRVEPPAIEPTAPSIMAVVTLNDGRSWLVCTDIKSAETIVREQDRQKQRSA